MAKYESRLTGNFDSVLAYLDSNILEGSVSASYEDGSDWSDGSGARCAVRVYERYSYIGVNRLSLTLSLMGRGTDLFLSAIASGGSQAVFVKINTWGEEAFLDKLIELVEQLKTGGGQDA